MDMVQDMVRTSAVETADAMRAQIRQSSQDTATSVLNAMAPMFKQLSNGQQANKGDVKKTFNAMKQMQANNAQAQEAAAAFAADERQKEQWAAADEQQQAQWEAAARLEAERVHAALPSRELTPDEEKRFGAGSSGRRCGRPSSIVCGRTRATSRRRSRRGCST